MRYLIVISLAFCLHTASLFAQKEFYPVSQIPDSLRTDAYSVVRLESNRFEYYDVQNGLQKVTRVVTILDEKGSDEANCEIELGKFWELKRFSGEVFDESGKSIRKLKQSDLHTSSISEHLASDEIRTLYDYGQPTYPYTIKYEFEVKWKNGLIMFPPFCPVEAHNQSVQEAEYILQAPTGTKFQLHALNMSNHSEQSTVKGNDEYVWKIKGLKAIDKEPDMPEFSSLIPSLEVKPENFYYDKSTGNEDTWNSFGKWQWGLLTDRDILSPKAIDKVKEIVADAKSDKEKVKRLYNFLQTTTRYVSIQLGIGGLQPIAATSVNETGFGDCKGLTNYLKAMLKVAGINSYYTIIRMGGIKKFITDFASPSQANHVILTVLLQNDTIPLECTSSYFPFGFIHSEIAGHDALLVTPEGGKLYRLHSYPDTANYTHTTLRINLDNNGLTKAKACSMYALSEYEEMLPFEKLMNSDERLKDIKSDYRLPNMSISGINVAEKHDETPIITLNYDFSSETYANKSGARIFLPVNPRSNAYRQLAKKNRKYIFDIPSGHLEIDTIIITIPENFKIEAIPANISINKAVGKFVSTITQQGNTIKVVQHVYKPKGIFPASMNNEFKEFIQSINNAYTAQIVLKTP